jgi:glycosyltransferase involved in cell wall biosynthesis
MTEAAVAVLPVCFLNGRVADLIGLGPADDRKTHSAASFQNWIDNATLRGLVHLRMRADAAPGRDGGGRPPISLGIDAAGLLGGLSGAQVFVIEMVREMVTRAEIGRVVFLSATGAVPRWLEGTPKVSGCSWADVLAGRLPRLDIVHRPTQPTADVDYGHYYRAARCVALTVLDFIAYDNPSYHESREIWREHQRAFDQRVCQADGVFAISAYVGGRLQRQFAHQLAAPVRAIPLGTDHLDRASRLEAPPEPGSAIASLAQSRFLLVLGNDFAHKNRDFAVKVFEDMSRRGYDGRLVLAGFHVDNGSSFDREVRGVDDLERIMRIGWVAESEATWLLRHAEVMLYPTSSEGFGLIPFEAAALGTPTAFVKFGPLREMMPGVRACAAWQVRAFADHVFELIEDPTAQIAEIRAAGAALTWRRCVDQMIDAYQGMLDSAAPWHAKRRLIREPAVLDRAGDAISALGRRAVRKLRRSLRIFLS